MCECLVDDVIHGVALHFPSAYGRECASDACEEQAQVFVDFRRCPYRGAWVASRHLLFDGDGRRQSLDIVAFGFVHPSEKLPGICGEAFHIAALAFGIEGIECQRTFSASGKSGDDHEFVARDFNVDVLEVVYACAFDEYGVCHGDEHTVSVRGRGVGDGEVLQAGLHQMARVRGILRRTSPAVR